METKMQNQSEVQIEAIDGSNKLHWSYGANLCWKARYL